MEYNRHHETDWLLSLYTISDNPFSDEMKDWKPYDIAVDRKTGKRVFFDPVNENTFTIIEGLNQLTPIIEYKSFYNLMAGQLPNVKENLTATGGTILLNIILLCIPFKDKIPFITIKGIPLREDKAIKTGSVLDSNGRGYWACSQIMEFLKLYEAGKFDHNNSIIYFHDFWHPGIEALSYAFELSGKPIPKRQVQRKPLLITGRN